MHCFLARTLSTALAAGCFMALSAGSTSAADKKPNFVLINIDDLGYADVGPFGSKLNRTPNLDQMARDGRKLTCFYAAPVCSPSRASLMTGCYPKRALSIPHVLFPGNAVGLAPEEVTLAELLKKQGYATGIIGKWHLGDQPEFLPTRQGFDYYYGLPYSNDMGPAADGVKSNLGKPLPKPRGKGQPPLPLMRNETVLQRVLAEDQTRLVENYTREAIEFLRKHRDEPFFLYLPHSAVHFPLYPGKAFQGKSGNGLYGDWVEEVDWSVGQVLAALRELKLEDNTLVIFTSDNGGSLPHGAVNKPLRGGKGSTWEGGMRVPTIARWPGKIPAGTQSDAVTGMMDMLPTLVKLAGGQVPDDRQIDGGDVWPILSGQKDARSPHEVFYFFRGHKLQAVRSGPWKLHFPSGELYNLADDISESKNLAQDHPEEVKRLTALAEKMDDDLGRQAIGKGCRPLGKVNNARPLIDHEGQVRPGFEAAQSAPAGAGPVAGMGIMVGEVSPNSALVQVRLTAGDRLVDGDVPGKTGVVRFELRPEEGEAKGDTFTLPAAKDNDYIARAHFEDLVPGTQYVCHTSIGADENSLRPGPVARFRTLGGAKLKRPVRLVVVTGMNYAKFHGDRRIDRAKHVEQNNTELPAAYAKGDKHLGYPALETIRKLKPDFFIGTGDNVYYDTPTEPRAKSAAGMRRKWHEQFVQPRYRQLFAEVPTYWEIDDHDYRVDDCDNSGDYEPSVELAQRMVHEQLPISPAEAAGAQTYRTIRPSRDVQIWLLEGRFHRSPNKMTDGPDKSIWGAKQKAWLKRTLAASDATFKLVISPTPLVGPDDKRKTDNHCDIGGFQHERDEFFTWLKSSGVADGHFYLLCGDRHWQYHAQHPAGIEEFSTGALVDANSRPGRKAGDPQSTDPDAKIKQPYLQDPPSGGFLLVEATPAKDAQPAMLAFKFHDEQGKLLYEARKMADEEN